MQQQETLNYSNSLFVLMREINPNRTIRIYFYDYDYDPGCRLKKSSLKHFRISHFSPKLPESLRADLVCGF